MSLAECWRAEYLADEPFCDDTHNEDEILYAGSDEEHYGKSDERRRRIEIAAHRYLDGHTPVLLAAVLRGPFEGPEANGWVNPWSSKRGSTPPATAPALAPPSFEETDAQLAETDVSDADSTTSCHLPSPRSLNQANVTPHPHLGEEELGRVQAWRSAAESAEQVEDEPAWSFASDILLSQSQSHKKRRSMGSDWLRREDVKRRRAEHAVNIEGASMVAQLHTQRPTCSRMSSQPNMSQESEVGDSMQDITATQPQTRSSRRSSRKVRGVSSRRQSPQTPAKATQVSEDQNLAPLSTPLSAVREAKASPWPKTAEQGDSTSEAGTITRKSREKADSEVQFETQEDESFLFRARPRSRGLEATAVLVVDSAEMETSSLSSVPSGKESESDAENEAMDLDGDTYMADDTNATSPESTTESKDRVDEIKVATEAEPEVKEPTLRIADMATNTDHDDSEVTGQAESVTGADLADSQHHQEDMETEEELTSASQERTIVAQPMSPLGKGESLGKGHASSPVTPRNKQPTTRQSIENPSASQRRTLVNSNTPTVSQQSPWQTPWSKGDLSVASIRSHPVQATPAKSQERALETPSAQQNQFVETPVISNNSFQGTPMALQTPVPISHYGDKKIQVHSSQCRDLTSLRPGRDEAMNQQRTPAISASQQSPWEADVPPTALLRPLRAFQEASQDSLIDPGCQSPWTASPDKLRLAAQRALVSSLFKPPISISSSPNASSIPTQPETPRIDPAPAQEAPTPADPTPRLSTPEPVFEIKRFANFMSPSPQKPKRKLNKARAGGGHLPSTQNLLAVTIDNPWDGTQRLVKRVTWAPEVKGGEGFGDSEPTTPGPTRATSPPPDLAVADLPTDTKDKFHDHFQAVSRRTKITHRLLPSASQQVLESPTPMGMAEAFLRADSFGPKTPTAPKALMVTDNTPLSPRKESQASVDDVDEVLLNLNEFINMVDVEADLARAKEQERKEQGGKRKQEPKKTESTSGGLFGRLSFSGLMDSGVWES